MRRAAAATRCSLQPSGLQERPAERDPFLLKKPIFHPTAAWFCLPVGRGRSLKSSSCSSALPACAHQHCSIPPGAAAQMCLCSRCAASLQTCSSASPQSCNRGHDSGYILNFRQDLTAGTQCQGSEHAWGLPSTGAHEVRGLSGVAKPSFVLLRTLKVIFFSLLKL